MTVYPSSETGEIRGGGVPRLLAITVFTGRMTVYPSSSTPPMIDHIILHRAPTPSWERPDANACGA